MNRLMLLACALALLPGEAMSTDIYKWKDADGNTRYSDALPSGKMPDNLITGRKPERAKAQEDSAAATRGDAGAAKSGGAKSGPVSGDQDGAGGNLDIERPY